MPVSSEKGRATLKEQDNPPAGRLLSEAGIDHPYAEVALQAIQSAAAVCRAIQNDLVAPLAKEKADRSPVTVADYASQAVICRLLSQSLPEIPVVAEETSSDLRAEGPMLAQVTRFVGLAMPQTSPEEVCDWIELGNAAPAGRFWTLDPIDGTAGFLRREQYAIALALIEDGQVQLGFLACPNLPADLDDPQAEIGMLYLAARGQGAFGLPIAGRQANRVRVNQDDQGAGIRFVESVESGHADHETHQRIASVLGITSRPVRLDSQAKYAVVARGDASIYLRLPSPSSPDYRERIWDHAAGAVVVEEAGGRVTDASGKDLDFGQGRKLVRNRGVVVSNGRLHAAILAALESVRPT